MGEIEQLREEVKREQREVEQWKLCSQETERRRLECMDELAEFREALGLLTTLHPRMEIDTSDPKGMAEEIHLFVTASTKEVDAFWERLATSIGIDEWTIENLVDIAPGLILEQKSKITRIDYQYRSLLRRLVVKYYENRVEAFEGGQVSCDHLASIIHEFAAEVLPQKWPEDWNQADTLNAITELGEEAG